MIRPLVICLFFFTQLIAIENMKIKAIQVNEIIKTKILIPYNMRTRESAKARGLKPKYITQIIVMNDKKVLYNLLTNGYLSKNPIFKFSYVNKSSDDTIILNMKDSDGKEYQTHRKIRNYIKNSTYEKRNIALASDKKIPQEVWTASTTKEGIHALYGVKKRVPSSIKFSMDKNKVDDQYYNLIDNKNNELYIANRKRVFVNLQSDIKLKSIAIFNDSSLKSAIAIFKIPNDAIINYSFTIIMNTGTLTVIGEDSNGYLHETNYKVFVLGSDMDCDGSSNGSGG